MSQMGTSFFVRSLVGWDVAFWALLGVSAVVLLGNDLTTGERIAALAIMAGLGVMYALVGRPAIRTRNLAGRNAYRIALVLAVLGLVYISPAAMFLLFIVFAQMWVLSDRIIEGAIFSVAVVVATMIAELSRAGWSFDHLVANLPWWAISLAVSIVFGVWISKIIDESEQRAALIADLERTRAELAQANHAAGVVAERERIAREIHDTLAQGFVGIVTLAEAAQNSLVRGGDNDDTQRRLEVIEDIARENLAEARALVAAFSPVALAGSTLADAMQRLATRFTKETGVETTIVLADTDGADADRGLPAAHQVVLLRAVQEAFANVGRHAGATAVTITLQRGADGTASVEVSDNGSGFDPRALADHGFGLVGMRGRVEEVGGELAVASSPATGTRVRVRLPAASS